jgi:hypothetical protein
MLPAPRIIAIDDKLEDLKGLAEGLNAYGAACLQFHFTGSGAGLSQCPHVRVIFADLHLTDGGAGGDHTKHFSVIGGLIEETIVPTGPYFVVLWTNFPDQAANLQTFLERIKGVPKPMVVAALNKAEHLGADGKLKDVKALIAAIGEIVRQQPRIAALLNWEDRALDAAADTVSAILGLIPEHAPSNERPAKLGKILAQLAAASVGVEHVDKDRFHAVNEALVPIIFDRMSALRVQDADKSVWDAAFDKADIAASLSVDEAAVLNRFLHIAKPATATGADRGAVIKLPATVTDEEFEKLFTMKKDAAAKQFACATYNDKECHWMVVQAQAACDYAQSQPGSLPFYVGLELPLANLKQGSLPAATWTSPVFEANGVNRMLAVNARFPLPLPVEIAKASAVEYRLREALINDLTYKVHSYGARPGIISFRGA